MTLAATAPSSRPRWASARSPRRRSSPPDSARRSTRRPAPAVAGLLGCGVMAGLGAAINTGNVGRGSTVAVIGCGGVGDAAIAGAALAGASKIIAVDIDDRKLETAARTAAPRTRSTRRRSTRRGDPLAEAAPTARATRAAPTSSSRRSAARRRAKQAFYARDLAGTVVLVGVPTPDMKVPEHPAHRRLRPRRRRSSRAGTATACPRATSRCSSTSTCRAGSTSTRSSPRRSASATSRPPSTKMHHGDVLRSVVVL